jgi:hypothetical protein
MDRLKHAIEMQAEWRHHCAGKYPYTQQQNRNAAAELERLAGTVADVSEATAAQYDALWAYDSKHSIGAAELEDEMLRSIGFSGRWRTAEEFTADLVKRATYSVAA